MYEEEKTTTWGKKERVSIMPYSTAYSTVVLPYYQQQSTYLPSVQPYPNASGVSLFPPSSSLASSVCRDAFLEYGGVEQYLVGGSGVKKPTYEVPKPDIDRIWAA